MSVTKDGHFHAYAFRTSSGPELGLSDDIACSQPQCEFSHSGIIYAGTYRLDRSKFIMRVTFAQNEGPVGVDAFDLTWTEGRSPSEEERHFQVEASDTQSMIL